VIKLEGGNDHDLHALDATASASNTTLDNDAGNDDAPKPSSDTNEALPSEKAVDASSAVGSAENKVC
jgi:hypothetical protein